MRQQTALHSVKHAQDDMRKSSSGVIAATERSYNDVPLLVNFHEAEVLSTFIIAGQASESNIRIGLAMVLHKLEVVHSVPGTPSIAAG